MKIVQKCGPCGGELTVEGDSWPNLASEVNYWRRNHTCLQTDQRGRTGTGFAATSTATDSPQRGWRRDATGPRRVEASGQRTPPAGPSGVSRGPGDAGD